jgi:hypothetical protein
LALYVTVDASAARDDLIATRGVGAYRVKRNAYLGKGEPDSVPDQLDQMTHFEVGRVLLGAISVVANRNNNQVLIGPDFRSYIIGLVKPTTAPVGPGEAGVSMGMPLYDQGKLIGGSGTGTGTSSVIRFSPEMFPGNLKAPGSQRDEILFHEMIHAFRQLNGRENAFPVNLGYDDIEEYVAVVITKSYLSDKGQTDLRASHHDSDGVLKNPEKFLDNPQNVNFPPRWLMYRLYQDHLSLFDTLAAIRLKRPAQFNPVKQYKDEMGSRGWRPPDA